ncbi:universal stress protein [Mycobacterium intermedium]|uniref:Universal stress protein n=1 Tax=Mycobacterium intermedium TaxID=28445 RepID=A0A1E3SFK3_MYCIE|nr:universal stress protein [Mycobacterium intermedium]MCV6966256.1 universal stress protein [Mycobacterium intermedium]ODR00875.1 universal stress protein [Mycobacterium intermedium]OPE52067.1 universal stress protein [Mycobacterium intermedium]ORB09767.1 universal stress protein [Mycobacterium intermedium]
MDDICSAPSVVVGIDGSKAAVQAALWAVDEAVSRDIPLRLVYVINAIELSGEPGSDDARMAGARLALHDASRAVAATGKPVKIETEILRGKPLNKLLHESANAAMICVGSMGLNHARRGQGSVAATLAGAALCPVAVIHRDPKFGATPEVSAVVAEVDNGAVLRYAFAEARLRGVPLRAISVHPAEAPDDVGAHRTVEQPHLSRRLARWTRLYPDVQVESEVVHGHACRYMAHHAKTGELLVTDAHAAQVCSVYNAGCSVLTVRCANL